MIGLKKTIFAASAMLLGGLSVIAPSNQSASAIDIDVRTADYGYGKYVVRVQGRGYDGVYDEDATLFYYLPVRATIRIDEMTNKYYVDLEYYVENQSSDAANGVDKIVITIYDENGQEVEGFSPITINSPIKTAEIPFAEYLAKPGKYTISVAAYDSDGNLLYEPYELQTQYETAQVPDAGAPDTGGLFRNLNVSREDYLATGLIVFFVLGIIAFGIVWRGRRSDSERHSSKKRR